MMSIVPETRLVGSGLRSGGSLQIEQDKTVPTLLFMMNFSFTLKPSLLEPKA
jgi:hypothetical protein